MKGKNIVLTLGTCALQLFLNSVKYFCQYRERNTNENKTVFFKTLFTLYISSTILWLHTHTTFVSLSLLIIKCISFFNFQMRTDGCPCCMAWILSVMMCLQIALRTSDVEHVNIMLRLQDNISGLKVRCTFILI